jgi:indole-3-glycerol phosphate synthase
VTGPRRLSQAISEGDGISLVVAVAGPEEAQRAEARGAEALLAEDGDIAAIRAACVLPILTAAGSAGDARLVRPGDEDVELGEAVELVVQVEREEELEEALERLDPELFVLFAAEADEPLEHVLDLLSDIPAGKLAIADVGGVTQAQIDELERAGVDAVLVRELM